MTFAYNPPDKWQVIFPALHEGGYWYEFIVAAIIPGDNGYDTD